MELKGTEVTEPGLVIEVEGIDVGSIGPFVNDVSVDISEEEIIWVGLGPIVGLDVQYAPP